MATNAENFAPNNVVLDIAPPDGVLRVYIKGEAEPRLVLSLDGTVRVGNGATAPTVYVDVNATNNAVNYINSANSATALELETVTGDTLSEVLQSIDALLSA